LATSPTISSWYASARASLSEFTLAVQGLSTEKEYHALVDNFGIRRAHPSFRTYSDALQDTYAQQDTGEAALLDYNQLENG
jgi:hypothetical protein